MRANQGDIPPFYILKHRKGLQAESKAQWALKRKAAVLQRDLVEFQTPKNLFESRDVQKEGEALEQK